MVQLIVAIYSSVLQYPLCASADGYPRYPHALLRHYPLHVVPDLYQRYIYVFLLHCPLCAGLEGTLPTLYACVFASLPSLCGFRDLYQRYVHVFVGQLSLRQTFTNLICMYLLVSYLSIRLLPTLHACVVIQLPPPSDLYQRYIHVFLLSYPIRQTFTNVICMYCDSITTSAD